ncbi:MAG: CrcB family protein [Acidobacteria bacterium]|jgi:CrcB protein|nr:CrcB family protein [Acidobacteriota bacterium]
MAAFLLVGIGGAIGSMARYSVSLAVNRWSGSQPLATAIVNIVGCALIGLMAGLVAAGAWRISTQTRAFAFAGVMGGFTTFSAFGLDTLTLVQGGRVGAAVGNVAIQLVVGLGAAFAGYAAAVSLK